MRKLLGSLTQISDGQVHENNSERAISIVASCLVAGVLFTFFLSAFHLRPLTSRLFFVFFFLAKRQFNKSAYHLSHLIDAAHLNLIVGSSV
jgi:hypothetical protein